MPQFKNKLHSFFHFCSFYKLLTRGFAKFAAQLYELKAENGQFGWDEHATEHFKRWKNTFQVHRGLPFLTKISFFRLCRCLWVVFGPSLMQRQKTSDSGRFCQPISEERGTSLQLIWTENCCNGLQFTKFSPFLTVWTYYFIQRSSSIKDGFQKGWYSRCIDMVAKLDGSARILSSSSPWEQ